MCLKRHFIRLFQLIFVFLTLKEPQEQLAELSDVGLRTLKSLESMKSNPTLETLTKLADVLGMELRLEVKQPKL